MEKYKPLLIILGGIVGISILSWGAYYLGQQKQVEHAESKNVPTKRFTAKPGTERDKAKAVTSTQRKIESGSQAADPNIKEWGSIENPDKKIVLTRTEQAIEDSKEVDTPEEAIKLLLKRLNAMEGNQQKSALFAALSAYYLALDPPMPDEAEKAIHLSWKYADTMIEKVDATFSQANYHMTQKEYGKVLEDIDRLETDSLPLTEHALELSMMMGISYEQLGFKDDAKESYKSLMTQAQAIGLEKHKTLIKVYSQAGFNLARILRDEGRESEAKALGRTVQETVSF